MPRKQTCPAHLPPPKWGMNPLSKATIQRAPGGSATTRFTRGTHRYSPRPRSPPPSSSGAGAAAVFCGRGRPEAAGTRPPPPSSGSSPPAAAAAAARHTAAPSRTPGRGQGQCCELSRGRKGRAPVCRTYGIKQGGENFAIQGLFKFCNNFAIFCDRLPILLRQIFPNLEK